MSQTVTTPNHPSRAAKHENWKVLLDKGKKALAQAVEIRVLPSCVHPMPGQPRVYFNTDSIMRLAESIRSVGQVYPGIVRKVGNDNYELLDGERRWRAITLVGIHYRALLVEIDDESVPFLVAAIANFNREGHTALEIADSIKHMYDDIGMPIEEIAKVLGITPHWAYQLLSLRHLHPDVRDMLDPLRPKEERLPVTAAINIAKTKPSLQVDLAKRFVEKDVSLNSLRKEVIRVSHKAGVDIRLRQLEPGRQWRSVGLRTQELKRTAHDLKQEFGRPDFKSIVNAGSGGFSVEEVLTSLQDAKRFLDDCETLLLKAHGKR
jgi:ParB family chromosome partitioning protein